ncbi:uncharacterized protein [Eucyclogobius newberryi]|uniref:uncharacterized protein n=1 Tax=Eucyclogobius newberryi TaxID=166745 RepID=UPI003B5AB765
MLLDLEGEWTDLLASNNVMRIIRGLRKITESDKAEVNETLSSFCCWLQRTSEFTKKELLSLCFSRCQGLWMFLNHFFARRVHHLLQKLRNLLTLVQWARRKLHSGHGHDSKETSSNSRRGCWNREHCDLKKHLWLGRLVEWWSLMGLLPKRPESQGGKQISHMWKEMSRSPHGSESTKGETERCSSLIQALVTHLAQQHGGLWSPESGGQQLYPPPSLKALLKLVLVPHVDPQSVQALLTYFILDIAKILQCSNDLFKSFCDAFTIPPSFSLQIRAFWMFDHDQIKTAMGLLLSPRTALPRSSWQHRCIMRSLLLRQEHGMALRYMHLTSPVAESVEDVKLGADVWLKNSCVSEAWALVKRNYTEGEDTVLHFLKACDEVGLSAEASKYIPSGHKVQSDSNIGVAAAHLTDPAPLSAAVYQAQSRRVLTSEELLRLLTRAVTHLRPPPTCTLREFTWPQREQKKAKDERTEVSTEVQYLRSPSPSIVEPPTDDYSQADHPHHQSSCTSPVALVPSRRHVSFSSVSSLSPIRRDQAFSYESTVTLQQISALLIDDQGEDEELSQVSATADVFPEYHERTLEGVAAPVIEHSHTPNSFRNRFFSADCVLDLPSLPEELVQTPAKSEEPEVIRSEIFQEDDPGKSVLRVKLKKGECELRPPSVIVSCETPRDLQLNVEGRSDLAVNVSHPENSPLLPRRPPLSALRGDDTYCHCQSRSICPSSGSVRRE